MELPRCALAGLGPALPYAPHTETPGIAGRFFLRR
jgi:hypothetical protein